MPGQNILGKCTGSFPYAGLINSITFAIQLPDISISNFSTGDCDSCPVCCSISNSYTDTGPKELSKTYGRKQSGPYFTLTKQCCSKCNYTLNFYDYTAGDGINHSGLTFNGQTTDHYVYGDGDLTNADGSYQCSGQQPSSGESPAPAYSITGSLSILFYQDDSGQCVFDLNVAFDDGFGGGSITAIPIADLPGTHTITFSATLTNPSSFCGTNPPSYDYEETYTITIA